MSEKRKKALVAYLAAIFGVAFLLVSLSLVSQMNKLGTANTTAAERVLALQTQLQELEQEKKAILEENGSLKENIAQIQEDSEYLEGIAHDATMRVDYLEHQLQAYMALNDAQQAISAEDQTLLQEALARLAEYGAFLQEEDQVIYQNILEQNQGSEE